MIEPRFEWPRYWAGQEARPDSGPFLPDPEHELGPYWSPGRVRLEALSERPFLILLGEPGAGKSEAIKDVVRAVAPTVGGSTTSSSRHAAAVLNVRFITTPEVLLQRLNAHAAELGAGQLFIDSVDESSIVEIGRTLVGWIAGEMPTELRLRIACRTAAANTPFLKSLLDAATERGRVGEVRRLEPLRQDDAELAAGQLGVDWEAFCAEARRVGAWVFAAHPISLLKMLHRFAREKRLLSSQREMWEEELFLQVERERNATGSPLLKPQLSAQEALYVLKRVATVTLLCGRASIWTQLSGDAPESCALLSELADAALDIAAGEQWDVVVANEDEMRRIVGLAPLYSTELPGEVAWRNRPTAEFLAAWYLDERGVPPHQLRSLLIDPLYDRVCPQLQGVAAALVVRRADVLRMVAERDPHVAIRGDLTAIPEDDRVYLAKRYLQLAHEQELDWSALRYTPVAQLRGERIAALVRATLTDPALHEEARRLAARIAEEARLSELADDLERVAVDRDELQEVRIAAAEALANMDEPERLRLRPLLNLDDEGDVDADLRGVALGALWPELVPVGDVLAVLGTPTYRENRGFYRGFLDRRFVPGLSDAEYPQALAWAADVVAASETGGFLDLINALLAGAYTRLSDPAVRAELTRLTVSCARKDHFGVKWPWRPTVEDENGRVNPPLSERRYLSAEILTNSPEDDLRCDLERHVSELLHDDAFSDYLEGVDGISDELGAQMARLVNCASPEHYDQWLTLWERLSADGSQASLERRACFERWLGNPQRTVELGSKEAKQARKWYLMGERGRAESAVRESKQERRRKQTIKIAQELIRKVERGISPYWQLDLVLTAEENGYAQENRTLLTSGPLWAKLTPAMQGRVVELARGYIFGSDDDPASWSAPPFQYRPALAGVRAIRLLRERGGVVPKERIAAWAVAIVGFPGSDYKPEQETLVAEAYDAAPVPVGDYLAERISTFAKEHNHLLMDGFLRGRLDSPLGQRIVAESEEWPSHARAELFKALGRAKYPGLPGLVRAAFKDSPPVLKEEGEDVLRHPPAAVEYGVLLAAFGEPSDWPLVRARLEAEPAFAEELLRGIAEDYSYHHGESGAPLFGRTALLAQEEIYRRLEDRHPTATDPKRVGAYSPNLRQKLEDLRSGVLSAIVAAGTAESIETIRRLEADYADHPYMRLSLVWAKKNRIEAEWRWPSPAALRKLLREGTRMLLRTSDELLSAATRSLERLQADVATNGREWVFWDEQKSGDQKGTWLPKEEAYLTDYVANWISNDLSASAVLTNREVVPRPGERYDILIQSPTGDRRYAGVVLEAKLGSNKEVWNGLGDQLATRYLSEDGKTHGLYLVAYFGEGVNQGGEQRPVTLEEWRAHFHEKAVAESDDRRMVSAFVLDLRLKDRTASKRLHNRMQNVLQKPNIQS